MKPTLYTLLCLFATWALCAPATADEPKPTPPAPAAEDPLTLAFAKAKPDPKACKALKLVVGECDSDSSMDAERVPLTVRGRVDAYSEYSSESSLCSVSTDDAPVIAQDQTTLIHCDRSANGYSTYADLELALVALAHKGASNERALTALDLAIQLSAEDSEVDGALLVRRAAVLADLGRIDDAYKSLQDGISAGFTAYYWISTNARFSALHKHPEWNERFQKMLPPELASVPIPLIEDKAHDLSFETNEPAFNRTGNFVRLCKDHSVIYGSSRFGDFDIWTVGRWELKPNGFWVTPMHTCMKAYENDEVAIQCKLVSEDQDLSAEDRKPSLMLSLVTARLAASGPHEYPFLTFENGGPNKTPEDADCESYLPSAAPDAPTPTPTPDAPTPAPTPDALPK